MPLVLDLQVEPTLLLLNVRLKSLLEFLNGQVFVAGLLTQLLRRNEHITNNLNDTIAGDTVTDDNVGEAVDPDVDKTSEACNVDVQALVLEHGRQSDSEEALWRTVVLAVHGTCFVVRAPKDLLLARTRLVVGVTVEGVSLLDDVVGKQSLEVLQAVRAEEECIDPGAKLLESEVAWREEGTTSMSAIELIEETSLGKTALKCRELRWEKRDDLEDVWGWKDDAVNTVDDTVGAEDVNGDDAGVEVDGKTTRSNVCAKTLR